MAESSFPNFAIIGAQKSASTFVQRALVDHPEVGMPSGETRLMEDPWYTKEKFHDYLQSLGSSFSEKKAIGIKRPDCLAIPDSAIRLRNHMPDAKLVIILRNPIDRALSAYFHYMRYDSLPLLEVSNGLEQILDGGLSGYPLAKNVLTYGRYGECLNRYLELFPREQLLILRHDDILDNKIQELRKVFQFLEISDAHMSKNLERRSQAVVYSMKRLSFLRIRSPLVFQWSEDRRSEEFRFGVFSQAVWYGFEAVDRYIISKIIPNDRPYLKEDLRDRLCEYYREDLEFAEKVSGLELSHWLD